MIRPGAWDIVHAGEADLDVLSQVIADAFADLAPSRWLIADPAGRRRIFPGYFRIHLEHALTHGHVHTTRSRNAAALWISGGPGAVGLSNGRAERLAAIARPWTSRFLAFDQALDSHHPAGMTHHHLAILAVHPEQQGRGIGTALLDLHHATLEEESIPAYLEASSPRARDLYLAHDYVPRPGAPVLPAR